jgi:hypothetical protein
MATTSILNNIVIKSRRNSRKFISALETAKLKREELKDVVCGKKVTELKGADIKEFFGDAL